MFVYEHGVMREEFLVRIEDSKVRVLSDTYWGQFIKPKEFEYDLTRPHYMQDQNDLILFTEPVTP